MSLSTAQSTSYVDYAANASKWVAGKGSQIIQDTVNGKGDTPKKVLGSTRTAIGIVSIAACPSTAIVSGVAASFFPEKALKASQVAEAMITGLWDKLNPETRLGLAAAGIAVVLVSTGGYDFPFLTSVTHTAACIFSAKLGVELALRNAKKEVIAEKKKAIEDDHDIDG